MIGGLLVGLLGICGGYILIKYGIQILIIGVTALLVALGLTKRS